MTLIFRHPSSKFFQLLESSPDNQLFILDRNPTLVKLLLNSLRDPQNRLVLPDDYDDWSALLKEVQYWKLTGLEEKVRGQIPTPATISISYHGTLAFGRHGAGSDFNFRKIQRIIVCGKVSWNDFEPEADLPYSLQVVGLGGPNRAWFDSLLWELLLQLWP